MPHRRGAARGAYADRKGRPKRVRYWSMEPIDGEFAPNDEVDEVRWLPVDEAMELLSYPHDRRGAGGPPRAVARQLASEPPQLWLSSLRFLICAFT